MNILATIESTWKKDSCKSHVTNSNKISIKDQIKFIKLNHKKKHRCASKSNQNRQFEVQYSKNSQTLIQSQNKNDILQKIVQFTNLIRIQTKKIFKDQKIQNLLQVSKIKPSEVKDNIDRYLKAFQDIVTNQSINLNDKLNEARKNNFFNQNNSHLRLIKSQQKMTQFFPKQSSRNNEPSIKKKIFNKNVANLLIDYFQKHMIPQTHWSNNKQPVKNDKIQVQSTAINGISCFNSFPSFNINFLSQNKNKQAHIQQNKVNNQAYVLKRTQSIIYDQINRNSQQIEVSNQAEIYLRRPIQETLQQILKLQDLKLIQNMTPTEKVSYIFDLQSKLYVASQFIVSAAYMQDNITTLPKQYYKNVWKFINMNDHGDQKSVTSSYRIMKKLMIITNASVLNQTQVQTQQNSLLKKLVFGLSFPRYILQYNAAKMKNQTFLRNPTIKMTKSIWNLPQSGMLKQLKKPFIFESIAFNLQFYVPRGYAENQKMQNIDIFTLKQNQIKVRLLNSKNINLTNSNKCKEVYQTIIIHAHGGGFIALSSCTMQSYTRKWANKLHIPIFSIDYGKPPQHRFPTPLIDCLDVYQFITKNIHNYMNIRPKRIILAGDSAGGNLVCSLNALIMRGNLQPIDSMFLAYPAMDTRKKFSPSRINSFNDAILYPTLLLLCMKQYLGQQVDYSLDPLANPILITQSFVSKTQRDNRWPVKWPKTIIMVGKKDPLLDDSINLCQRLSSSQIEFHCEIYKNLSHAFLSIDKMVTQCQQTIKDSIVFLDMLVNKKFIGKKQLLD